MVPFFESQTMMWYKMVSPAIAAIATRTCWGLKSKEQRAMKTLRNSQCFVRGWCWWVAYPTNGYWEHAELETSNLNHQQTLNIISLPRPKCHQRGKHEAFLRARFFMCRKGGTKSSSFLIQFILNDSFPGVSCLLAFSNLIQLCDIPICLQMRVTTNF